MVIVLALGLAGCTAGAGPPAARQTPKAASEATPEPSQEPKDWRKPRYVSVRAAVERLAAHVDVPVVLPRDRLAGIRSYRGWLADPMHIMWDVHGREGSGVLHLISRRNNLWIEYGYAIPDGCGGRDTAIPTDVLGEPALLWAYPGHSSIIWPVRPHGRTGRYGLSGSFDGYQILRLAEAMETALREAPGHDPGC